MPVGSSGRIGRVVIQHKRLARATGGYALPRERSRWRRSGSSSARNVSESAACAPRRTAARRRGDRVRAGTRRSPRGRTRPSRRARRAPRAAPPGLRRASATSPRERRQRAIDQRATRARPADRPRATRCGPARTARSPRRRRPPRGAPSPCCSASEPTQRRAAGIVRAAGELHRPLVPLPAGLPGSTSAEHVRGIDRESVLVGRQRDIPCLEEAAPAKSVPLLEAVAPATLEQGVRDRGDRRDRRA